MEHPTDPSKPLYDFPEGDKAPQAVAQQVPQALPIAPTGIGTMNRDEAYRLVYRAVRNGVIVAVLIISLIDAVLLFTAWKLLS